jgi:predicted aspartyl protease
VNITLRGEKGTRALKDILVDTGATYTTLSPAVLEQVGAFKSSYTKPTRPKGVAYFYRLYRQKP